MNRFAIASLGLALMVSGSGCCGLFHPMFGGGYGGGCQPCGGGGYGAAYPASPCGPGGCGAYAPNGIAPNAYYSGGVMQAGIPMPYQTTSLNLIPTY